MHRRIVFLSVVPVTKDLFVAAIGWGKCKESGAEEGQALHIRVLL